MSENVEAIERYYDAFNRGDWAGCMEFMRPDIEWDNSALPDGGLYRGHSGVREASRRWMGAWRGLRLEPERMTDLGDRVVVAERVIGTSKSTGISLDARVAVVWSMRNGIALRWKAFEVEAEALEYARSGDSAPDRTEGFPTVMGVVNVTPDSFSDGGMFFEAGAAIEHGRRLAAEGAAILDVGGESTRPGAEPVGEEEELRRVLPVVEELARQAGPRISIDTTKLAVARAALDAGAELVNDVSAFRFDPELAGLVAERDATCVLMHMLGRPRTMQADPSYDDVVSDVKSFLEERLEFATGEGIDEERVWLDPGIGFGKTVEHNLELLRRLDELVAIGRPIVIGTSRKSFLGKLTGRGERDRLAGTVATNVLALDRGASVFRVHDVAQVVDALTVAAATVGSHQPTSAL